MDMIYLILLFLFGAISAFSQPCYPAFSEPENEIYYFSFNDIVNNASAVSSGGITIYPDSLFSTKLTIGQSYQMQVFDQYQSGVGTTYGVWIDYNNDDIYSSNENVYNSESFVHGFTISILIPSDTTLVGKRKLRIIGASSTSSVNPCGTYNYGECEEYTIEFVTYAVLPAYCIPVCTSSGSPAAEIEDFSFNSLHNCLSGQSNPSYTHYPDSIFTTILEMGKSYYLFVSKGNVAGISIGVKVFLDYDNDHLFGSDECILSTTASVSNTLMTIPFDSSFVGKRRLRVFSTGWNVPGNACASYSVGEVEDYDITIAYPTQDTSVVIPNQWENVYAKSGYQTATKVVETYDKGYLICGTDGTYGDYVHTLKTTIDGTILSDTTYNWPFFYYASGLDETFDGGYVIAGVTNSGSSQGGRGFIKKFTPCGKPGWEQYYGDTASYGYLRDVYQMPDSGFIASGSYLFSNNTNDTGRICLLRTDKYGNLRWLNDYTYFYGSDVSSFIQTEDNGGIITLYGYTIYANDSTGTYWRRGILTKVDSLGNLEWNLVLDTNNIISYTKTSVELHDNGFISAGFVSEMNSYEPKLAFFRSSKDGKLLRYKIHENTGYYYHMPGVIRKINENRFFLLCSDISDCDLGGYFPHTSVMIIDSSFTILNSKQLSIASIQAEDAIINSDGKAVIAGTILTNDNYDIYVAKLNAESLSFDTLYNITLTYDSLCNPPGGIAQRLPGNHDVILSPNPAAHKIKVEIEDYNYQKFDVEIINSSGLIIETLKNFNDKAVMIDLEDLPRGIYFVRVIFKDGTFVSKKIIKM
jgi:hypothetical protein